MSNRNDFRLNDLNKFFYSMNLIKSTDKNSFYKLADKILKHLETGSDENKLKNIIESELCVTYGLYSNEFDSEQLSNDVLKWWKNSNY